MTPPVQVAEQDPQPTKSAEPITRKRGVAVVKSPPSTAPKKDIVNDKPTQREFGQVVNRHPRAQVNVQTRTPPTTPPPNTAPPTTPPSTGTPPLRDNQSKWTKTAPRPSEKKPSQPVETTRDKKFMQLVSGARNLLEQLRPTLSVANADAIKKKIDQFEKGKSFDELAEYVRKLLQLQVKTRDKEKEDEELKKQEQRRLEEERRKQEEERKRKELAEQEEKRRQEERVRQQQMLLRQQEERRRQQLENQKVAAEKKRQELIAQFKKLLNEAKTNLDDSSVPWPPGEVKTRWEKLIATTKMPNGLEECKKLVVEVSRRAEQLKQQKKVVPTTPPTTQTKPVPPKTQAPPKPTPTTPPSSTTDTRSFDDKLKSLKVKGKEKLSTLKTSRAGIATAVVNSLASFPEGEEGLARQQQLMDAVRFGPISKGVDTTSELGRKRELAKAKIIESFSKYPDLVLGALDLINDSTNPDAIAAAVAELGPIMERGFGIGASATESQTMAINALRTGSIVGGDFAQRLKDYYASDKPTQPDTLRGTGATQTTLNYSGSLGKSLLKPDGKVDFNSPGAKSLVDNLQFHPDSLKSPLLNFVKQIETFKKQFAQDPKCAQALTQARDPIGTGAPQDLIRSTLKLAPNEKVTANHVKASVLSAMLTPLTQAQVGSCFATSNCIEYQERKPGEMMQDLVMIGTKGTLQKNGSDPVAAVKRVPSNDNSLLRSFEYTIATLGARAENSDKKKDMEVGVQNGLLELAFFKNQPNIASQKRQIYDEAFRVYEEQYNIYLRAHEERERLLELYRRDNRTYATQFQQADAEFDRQDQEFNRLTQLKNQAESVWQAAADRQTELVQLRKDLQNAARDVLKFTYDPELQHSTRSSDGQSSKGGWTSTDKNGTAVTNATQFKQLLIDTFTQVAGTRASRSEIEGWVNNSNFNSQMDAVFPTPWKSTGGGTLEPSKQVLSGRKNDTKKFSEDKPGNAGDLLKTFAGQLKSSTEDMVSLSVDGIHAMRGFPQHESLKQLKASSNPEALVEQIFQQTERKANQPLDLDQQSYLHRKLMDVLGQSFFHRKVDYSLPTTAQTPAQFITSAMNGLRPLARQYFSPPEVAEQQVQQHIEGFVSKEIYGDTQFVLADTNWGDGSEKYLHVVAADPKTGQPKLYKKGMFSGNLEEQDAKWLDTTWSFTVDV